MRFLVRGVPMRRAICERGTMFDAFFASTTLVALAEIGDKTMLLAIILATRFRKPVPIIAGIFAATIVNHALAALLGSQVAGLLDSLWFRYAIALGFLAMAAWTLVPDTMDEEEGNVKQRGGVFLTTTVAFFIVEMGDKTQIATIALGARFDDVLWVTLGTTLGMMIANIPAVYLGEALVKRVSMNAVRIVAAALFLLLGLWQLAEIWGWL